MKTGKVYKIIHNQSNITYIGSTFNSLRDRWRIHKDRFTQYKKNSSRNLSIHTYFEKYGIENFKIILIKEYEVEDRNHLESKEQLWINKIKCINIQSAFNPLRRNKLSRKIQEQSKKYICECGIELLKSSKFNHLQI